MAEKINKRNNLIQRIIHPIMLALYKATAGFYITNILLKAEKTGVNIKKLKGSYIIIGNHVTNYDGFIFQQHAADKIGYVINERIFRMRFLGPILYWVNMIPKKKFTNDLKTVRYLFAAKQQGRIIGIFPEGRRNWDGTTTDIISSISTLVKSLKLPVVAGIAKGAYSSDPRWDNRRVRSGRVVVDYKMILTTEDIKNCTADEILDIIIDALDYKEHEYLKDKKIFFKCKDPADGLERLLFICPKCKQIDTFKSHDDIVECICGYSAKYDNYGKLESEHFENLEQWNIWQKKELHSIKNNGADDVVFEDVNVTFSIVASSSYARFVKKGFGTAMLYRDKIVFEGIKKYEFDIKEIWGCQIQKNNSFEFNCNDVTYLFTFEGKDNAYKWTTYMEL